MFEKNNFSKVLSNINSTYHSMSEMARKTGVDRAYISRYINMAFDNPPTPDVLRKLANACNGVTSYFELMAICGYINLNDVFLYTNENEETNLTYHYKEDLKELGISNEDLEIISKPASINKIVSVIEKYSPEIQKELYIKLFAFTNFSKFIQGQKTLDVNGLDAEDIEALQKQIDYMRWKKSQK